MINLRQWIPEWYTQLKCPFTRAAFLDIISLCGMAIAQGFESQSTIGAWASLTASLTIGAENSIDLKRANGNALLQRSLARLFFIDRTILRPELLHTKVSRDNQSIGDALLLLEMGNPDTCAAALDTLGDIIQLKAPRGPLMQISLILVHIYTLIQYANNPEVLSKAQSVLANGLSRPGMTKSCLSLIKEADLLSMLDKLETRCVEAAPSNMQSALHLLGFFLDWTYHEYPAHRQTLLHRIARYIRVLRMAIIDTNPFDARFAAAQSVSALQHIWTMSPSSKSTGPLLLGLTFVLYDMLTDDDDEIRDTAALATTKLLQAHVSSSSPPSSEQRTITPAVPILTTHRLANFLITTFAPSRPGSEALCKEALRRLTGTPSLAPPFTSAFAAARKEDTALFSTEKQNLFKDDTLDAVLWSRVLSLLPCSIIPPAVRSGLTTWVLEALAVLTSTAEKEIDGALGWSAKPEVFTLGMRGICAAEVVVRWNVGSQDASTVRRMLREFVDIGEESEVHGIWLDKVERVLEQSVVDVLRCAKERLIVVEKAVGN